MHITYDDQQQINTFARHNARLQDIKEELVAKQVGDVSIEVEHTVYFLHTLQKCKSAQNNLLGLCLGMTI